MRYILDTEYDGHNGPLLSLSLISCDRQKEIHIVCGQSANDAWVVENVIPKLFVHQCTQQHVVDHPNKVGSILRGFLFNEERPMIVVDSMTDIVHFARAYVTSENGEYVPNYKQSFVYRVENIDSYPTDIEVAVQHNSWWDCVVLNNCILKRNSEMMKDDKDLPVVTFNGSL